MDITLKLEKIFWNNDIYYLNFIFFNFIILNSIILILILKMSEHKAKEWNKYSSDNDETSKIKKNFNKKYNLN